MASVQEATTAEKVDNNSRDMTQSFDKHFVGQENVQPPPQPETNITTEEISTMDKNENKSPEFIQFMKERDVARATLKEKELELYHSQGKNYELLKKIDNLEKQLKEFSKSSPKTGKKHLSVDDGDSRSKSPVGRKKSVTKRPAAVKEKKTIVTEKKQKGSGLGKNKPKHPFLPGRESLSEDTRAYYSEIANLLPLLRISVLLAVEKKFLEADVNGDGTIDAEELEKVLTNNVVMCSRAECEKILKDLDNDHTGTLDFLEVLTVVDRLFQNKKTNLPQHLTSTQSKSTICIIQ